MLPELLLAVSGAVVSTGPCMLLGADTPTKQVLWLCRTVYMNKAGNAARVAASLAEVDLDDLPRIASGEARQQLAESATAGPAGAFSAAGMQGITMKPS